MPGCFEALINNVKSAIRLILAALASGRQTLDRSPRAVVAVLELVGYLYCVEVLALQVLSYIRVPPSIQR
jgi:hypothetical protein